MKKLACIILMCFLFVLPARASHTSLYSAPTKNCVPPIVALYWYNPFYLLPFLAIRKHRGEHAVAIRDTTPACWMGKASRELHIRHKRFYTPEQSRRIREWFRDRT